MQLLKNQSIRKKLISIIMLTSIISLAVASAGFISVNIISTRRSATGKLSTLARTIGINCRAAIIFKDQETARETLSALNAEPEITYACITDINGNIFAEYVPENTKHDKSGPEQSLKSDEFFLVNQKLADYTQALYLFHKKHLDMFVPIFNEDEFLGRVFLCSNLKSLYSSILWNITFCTLILCGCAVLAYFLSINLQKTISDPILELSKIMEKVSSGKDYSIRVESRHSDEMGILYDGFNNMLAQIQQRDDALLFTQYAVDHMGDMAFWIDSEGMIIYANNSACISLGYTCDELESKDIYFLDPNYSIDIWKTYWANFKNKKNITKESTLLNKAGHVFPVEINVNYVQFKGRDYNLTIARDITARKRIESQLQQAQKMEAIGTLVGGVAHDLNNILGGLVGYPELLLIDMPPESPMVKPLEQILKSGEKAAAIVQDLLTLARRGVAVEEVVNLNDIVNEYLTAPEHEKIIQHHPDIQFKLNLDPDLLNIRGSFFHITKALMNLISNGCESIKGKGELIIATENRNLDRPYEGFQNIPEGDYAVLGISDSGTGIFVEDRSKIFEPFYTKKKMGRSGTGLGMTVVRGTVEDHKGYIDITDRQNGGTRFYVYFPVTRESAKVEAKEFLLESYRGSESILVVDDVKEQRDIASNLLGYLGYKVETVPSGEKAIEYLHNNTPDIIILDMIMDPGIDGLETCTKILEQNTKQKIIICSGFSETERVKQALNLGAYSYVKKPYRIKEIAKAVREALDFKLT